MNPDFKTTKPIIDVFSLNMAAINTKNLENHINTVYMDGYENDEVDFECYLKRIAPQKVAYNGKTERYHIVNSYNDTFCEYREKYDSNTPMRESNAGFSEDQFFSELLFNGKFFGKYEDTSPLILFTEDDAPWLGERFSGAYIQRWKLAEIALHNCLRFLILSTDLEAVIKVADEANRDRHIVIEL